MAADTVKLGLGKTMPPGYNLVRLDSGHFMWAHDDDIRESAIHWDRWAIYRSAWADSSTQNSKRQAPAEAE